MIATESNLSALCAEAKKPAARAQIDRANADRAALYALLKSERPKTRKNAARLLGALQCASDAHALRDAQTCNDAQALYEALCCEDTLFVIPSILLALGNTGSETARAAIKAYAPPKAKDDTELKHVEAIGDALESARARLFAAPKTQYTLLGPRRLYARAPEGFGDILGAELVQLGYAPTVEPDGCTLESAQWETLYRARCMSELLIPLGGGLPLEAAAIADRAAGELTVPYRIELSGMEGDRTAFLRQLKHALGGENNPAHYALELRVICHQAACDLYLKPSFDGQARYPWRARAISASMKPALGACLARYIAPQVKNPVVLDPFCGSGTLLFSCEQAFPVKSLLGVDISPMALTAARENARAGKSRARFIQKDVLKFEPREKADLIISNLPFGNRVGTHENNTALYAGFLRKLPALMAPQGVALLYTMEYRLLSELIKKQRSLKLVETRRTEAGGLLPWVFLLQMN